MADVKISALPAAAAMTDGRELPVNNSGVSEKVSGTLVKDWQGGMLRNVATANQVTSGGATAYLTNSNISVPAAKLRIGTVFRWWTVFSKGATGSTAYSYLLKIGTLGTTGDATILTLTSGATAAADTGEAEIIVTIRGPLSASCIAQGSSTIRHLLSTTGYSTVNEIDIAQATSGTWDATTANLIVGLAYTSGTGEVTTFTQLFAEAFNL